MFRQKNTINLLFYICFLSDVFTALPAIESSKSCGGFYHYRYVMLDSVDGTYGGPTSDGKNGTGMVGMVMRGVRTCVRMSAEANQWFPV